MIACVAALRAEGAFLVLQYPKALLADMVENDKPVVLIITRKA
jgi:hypothetical protein